MVQLCLLVAHSVLVPWWCQLLGYHSAGYLGWRLCRRLQKVAEEEVVVLAMLQDRSLLLVTMLKAHLRLLLGRQVHSCWG